MRVRRTAGQTMVEYAILVCLIAAVCIVVLKVSGRKTADVFVGVQSNLTTSAPAAGGAGSGSGGERGPEGSHW